MSLSINTNMAALYAHNSLKKTSESVQQSLERLSTGLRINKSADDAAGMSISNVMKNQAMSLGQAIRNANDGISIVQIADGALDEAISIINTIKTKAAQAAEDGQTLTSRIAIQSDIDKLRAELDTIARTTSFNGMKLLTGNFANKKFQIGAYTGQTIDMNIGSAESNKIGHVVTGNLTLTNASGGTVQLSIYSNLQNTNITINSVNLQYNNSAENGMGALANAINKVSDATGVTAQAIVKSTSKNAVAAGTTGADFSINGVTIGAVTVQANDVDGSLVNAINSKTAQTGVVASVDGAGKLTLTSTDGRAIKVTGDTGTVLAGSDMSTFGYVKLFQLSANDMKITDLAGGSALSVTSNLQIQGDTTMTIDSTLTANSVLGAGSSFKAGTSLGFTLTDTLLDGNISTTQDSIIKAGSKLAVGTIIKSGSVLGGDVTAGTTTTTSDSTLKTGSVLKSGTMLKAGTLVTTTIQTNHGTIAAGTVLNADATLSADVTLQADMIAKGGSSFAANSQFTAGSAIGGEVTTNAVLNVNNDMVLKAGSTITDATNLSIVQGSVIGGDFAFASSQSATLTSSMTLKAGSLLKDSSSIATGSTLGADIKVSTALTLNGDMTLAAGSQLAANSKLAAGTVLTNDMTVYASGSSGTTITLKAGTVLEKQYTTYGTNYINNPMTLKYDPTHNSVIAKDSILAANAGGVSGTQVTGNVKQTLADIDVTSQEGAQLGMAIADAALQNINAIKAGLGSVQNQLTSTIANLVTTQTNVTSATSQITDVDFAAESSNFSRMQILSQAGTFAMAQANAIAQNILRLLQ
ncbi:MAG: flagellin N-terminal helical domain-containing protein [Dissulfurimicrobium sp.]|uniref:flagellin N-terminal helical domain-containing protein n=1 Tax=Dissulfurimicrobium sp. TaxID=2022436 RepID=UPI00404B223F